RPTRWPCSTSTSPATPRAGTARTLGTGPRDGPLHPHEFFTRGRSPRPATGPGDAAARAASPERLDDELPRTESFAPSHPHPTRTWGRQRGTTSVDFDI